MTHHISPDIRQHDTHGELVGRADVPVAPVSSGALDAIIVPASRPAEHLDHAVTLAEAERCRLVVLCSRQARSDDVYRRLAERSVTEAVAVDLPAGYGHRWLEFGTSRPQKIGNMPEACAARGSDLSAKRNIGLILARMLGWDRVFFMDDDITKVGVGNLRRTVSMLGQQYYSVGMRVTDFPDNSVVCHARRATGKFQDVMVTGSVLAVDCTAPIGFFPDVYNEDWLFFYDDAAEHRLGTSGFEATQLRYDPFDHPQRAARQEFGDVLAEGLYALLHRGQKTSYATQDYWTNFLDARRGLLDAIISRAGRAPEAVREKMLSSVRAARECSDQIEPEFCEHYVRLWRKDLGRWQQTLKELPRVSSVAAALSKLDLDLGSDDRDGARLALQTHGDPPAVSPPAAGEPAAVTADLATADLATADLATADLLTADLVTADLVTAGEVASQGKVLAAVGMRFLLLAAFLGAYLGSRADVALPTPWRGRIWRAPGGLPWRHRSLRMIAAGRDAARTLSGRMGWHPGAARPPGDRAGRAAISDVSAGATG